MKSRSSLCCMLVFACFAFSGVAFAGEPPSAGTAVVSQLPGSVPGAPEVTMPEPTDAEAQFQLGVMYAQGQDVPQDDAQALKWFGQAAGQGHPEAQYNLGVIHATGQGVRQDAEQAFQWFSKAAEQGHVEAQYSLGVMYAKGEGIDSDYAQAVQWYTRAAEQGHAKAQSNLGLLYARGEGVPQDYKQAYIWFSIAVANGSDSAARNLEWVKSKLSPDAAAQAQAEVDALQIKAGGATR